MYTIRGNRHRVTIDGKTFWVDSNMEEAFIRQLEKSGFHGKWRRSRFGLGFGFARYTPDVELSIIHDSMNRHALVEFKPLSATQFPMRRRKAMLAVARFYKDAICLLYVEKTNKWFQIEPGGGLHEFAPPTPGGLPIGELSRPRIAIPIMNQYGKAYFVRPGNFAMKKTADGLEFFVRAFFVSPEYRGRKRQK